MSRNGSGTYSLPTGNPVVTNTTISSTWANTTLSDIANALSGSIAADGQTTATGNLQMGNNKIVNLSNGTNSTDAATYGQLTGIAGRLAQLVQSVSTSTASTSASGSYVTTGHSATITPTSSTSKILVTVTFTFNNSAGYDSGFTVYRGSTNIAGTNTNFAHGGTYTGGVTEFSASIQYLDSPATASSTTYTVYMLNPGSPSTLTYNVGQGNGSQTGAAVITLLEVSQ